jgi:hypothetical protein
MKSDSNTNTELKKFNDALKTVLKISPEELKEHESQWKENKAAKKVAKEKESGR